MPDFNGAALVAGLRDNGCTIASDLFTLAPIEGMGNGALASTDIPSGTALFSIPSSYLLSEHTSTLSQHIQKEDWASLEGGWTRLILALMWEDSRPDSPWRAYLDAMPASFTTPMWWPSPDLSLLKGTDIENRIGRESADKDYDERVAPLIARYPDVFVGDFSKESYHRQGSRVLSRSFTVPRARVDAEYRKEIEGKQQGEGEESDDEEEEEEGQVAVMVPMADMLNAAYEMDNARLFSPDEDEEDDEDNEEGEEQGDISMRSAAKASDDAYTMTTTRDIKAGEQIVSPSIPTLLTLPRSLPSSQLRSVFELTNSTTRTRRRATRSCFGSTATSTFSPFPPLSPRVSPPASAQTWAATQATRSSSPATWFCALLLRSSGNRSSSTRTGARARRSTSGSRRGSRTPTTRSS